MGCCKNITLDILVIIRLSCPEIDLHKKARIVDNYQFLSYFVFINNHSYIPSYQSPTAQGFAAVWGGVKKFSFLVGSWFLFG